MRVFRIEREKYLKLTLKGIGASRSNGFRWNSINTYLVYTAESRALSMLEISAHLDFSEDLPEDRYFLEIDISDDIDILELKTENLPKGWDAKPPLMITKYIGDDFVNDNDAAVLKVPSSIVPPESNYLINPSHSDAKRIKVVSKRKLIFDDRFKI